MPKTYKSNDGQQYVAESITDLARQLWQDSHHYHSGQVIPKGEWRLDAAYRASQATGKSVRGDSDTHFIEDLIETGLLKETGE